MHAWRISSYLLLCSVGFKAAESGAFKSALPPVSRWKVLDGCTAAVLEALGIKYGLSSFDASMISRCASMQDHEGTMRTSNHRHQPGT